MFLNVSWQYATIVWKKPVHGPLQYEIDMGWGGFRLGFKKLRYLR
jgi:hypothetical protein